MFLLFFVHLVPKIFGKMVSLLQISPSIRLTYQFCWCELKRAVNSTHGSLVLSLFKVATAESVRDAIVKLYYAELFFSYFGSVRKNTSANYSCELRYTFISCQSQKILSKLGRMKKMNIWLVLYMSTCSLMVNRYNAHKI